MMIMMFSSAIFVSPLRRRGGAKALSHEPFHLLEDQSSSLFGLFRRSEGGYQFIRQGFDSCCCCCCCCCCCRRLKSAFFALLDDDNDVNDDDDEPGKSDIICFCATKTERVVRSVLTNRIIK